MFITRHQMTLVSCSYRGRKGSHPFEQARHEDILGIGDKA